MMDDENVEERISWHMAIAAMDVNGVGELMQEAGERHKIQVCHSISVVPKEVYRLEFISSSSHGTRIPRNY